MPGQLHGMAGPIPGSELSVKLCGNHDLVKVMQQRSTDLERQVATVTCRHTRTDLERQVTHARLLIVTCRYARP